MFYKLYNYKIIGSHICLLQNKLLSRSLHLSSSNEVYGLNIKKKNVSAFYIKASDLHELGVYYNSMVNLAPNQRYSIIVRLSYIEKKYITDWKTLGDQIYLSFENQNDLYTILKSVHNTILARLDYTMELYSIKYDNLLGLQLLVYNVYYNTYVKEKPKTNLSLGVYKDLVNMSKNEKDVKLLPLSSNACEFGVLLNKKIDNNIVINISFIEGDVVDFASLISKHCQRKIVLYWDTDFYQSNVKGIIRIITINKKILGDICVKNINIYNKDGFNISKFIDIVDSNNPNIFKREIGNITLYIDSNGNIVNKEIKLSFNSIKPRNIPIRLNSLNYSDYKFGTLDIETYNDKYNTSKAYAIGFHVKDSTNTYYLGSDLDSNKLIVECLDGMLKEVYNNYTFYVHNFSKFDVFFLLKIVINLNENNPTIYNYDIVSNDSEILCIKISKTFFKDVKGKTVKRTYNIKIVDSLKFLNSSLHELCSIYKPSVVKTFFPYEFVNENTIFYIGKTPSLDYYSSIREHVEDEYNKELVNGSVINVNQENFDEEKYLIVNSRVDIIYKSLIKEIWNLKEETISYLSNDLISLFSIMEAFIKNVYREEGIHVTNNYTISSLSLETYLKNYYNNNIPLINKRSIDGDIRNSYFGGITEVYKPYGKNLYYYDVNSLYPYAALNTMPGLNCVYIDKIDINMKDYILSDEMFGFYYCLIVTNNLYFGLLPVRQTNGGIFMPEGTITGWYFSEELKFALEHGYNIQVIRGYKFDKNEKVFNKFVDHFFSKKLYAQNKVVKQEAKSILNHLYGRLGMGLSKPITSLLSFPDYQEILQTRQIVGNISHIGDKTLVTYKKDISQIICEKHDVDFKEACNYNRINKNIKTFQESDINNVSICISSAVTAYARIFMNKVKLDVINNKGNIYYTDTDSVITDVPLNSNIVGSEIGKFKLEYKLREGYFISNKLYCLVLPNYTTIIKARSDNSKKITYKDFVNLYNGMSVPSNRSETMRNYSEGYAKIKQLRPINLSSSAYKKRIKIYDNDVWSNTKPININMLETGKDKIHNSDYNDNNDNNYINDSTLESSILKNVLSFILGIILIPFLIYLNLIPEEYIDHIKNCFITNDKCTINKNLLDNNNKFDVNNSIKIKHYSCYKSYNNIYTNKTYNNNNSYVKNIDLINKKNEDYKIKELLTKKSKILGILENNYNKRIIKENEDLKVIVSMYRLNEQHNNIRKLNQVNDLNKILKDLKSIENNIKNR